MASHGRGAAAHATHHAIDEIKLSRTEVSRDLLDKVLKPRGAGLLIGSGLLFLVGLVGFALRVTINGLDMDDRLHWGYYAATLGFILTTFGAAPLVAFAFRMSKANWRRPLTRAAELWGIVSILILIMLIPLLMMLPSNQGRFSIWFDWPVGAPHVWLLVGFGMFMLSSLLWIWLPAIPDFAALREAAPGKGLYRRLALNWSGKPLQWAVHQDGLIMMGAFFFMNLIFAHFLYSVDFGIGLTPGWKDAIFPTYHALTALQGALATTIITLYCLRRWGGLKEYIWVEQFWALSKPLLSVSLLWFYFWWSGFIIFWYGKLPNEQAILRFLMFDVYRTPFVLTFLGCFVLPLLLLVWNPVRRSILGPTVVSCIILVGLFFDKVRIYVASFSVPNEQLSHHVLDPLPAAHMPDAIDFMMIFGFIGGAVFFYGLALRLLPAVSLWEIKEGITLRIIKPFLRSAYAVIVKTR